MGESGAALEHQTFYKRGAQRSKRDTKHIGKYNGQAESNEKVHAQARAYLFDPTNVIWMITEKSERHKPSAQDCELGRTMESLRYQIKQASK